MSQTVIGIFEHSNEAQQAKAYLLSKGFANENVDINTSGPAAFSSSTSTTETKPEEGIGDRISHFFTNLFENKEEATSHIEAARKGTTVMVYTKNQKQTLEAVKVLDKFGAVDVNEYADKLRSESSGATGSIPVIKEELQVGKRSVQTGGVRLRSRIVERPVEESIRLRQEHVTVERTPVNRVATEADFAGFKEGTVELTEHAERPVVAKEARVIEEVNLDKQVAEKQETINDTVRHTEVDTEQIPGHDNKFADDDEEDMSRKN